VPEDMHLADRGYLIDRAFKMKRDIAASQYSDAELALLVANTGNVGNDRTLREVHRG
jgi:flagellar biosynthesis protein FlhF